MCTSIEKSCENEMKLIGINHERHHKLSLIIRCVLMMECLVILCFIQVWNEYDHIITAKCEAE